MRSWLLALLLFLGASSAFAQPANIVRSQVCDGSNPSVCATVSGGALSITGSTGGVVSTTPAPVKGFGTLSATNASTLLSTLTAGPSSGTWPTVPGQVYVMNSVGSGGLIYVCPLGGTCSASVGIPISAGNAYGFYEPSTSMTVFAVSTATVIAQW